MSRAHDNVAEMSNTSILLVYALVMSLMLFFFVFHCILSFVATAIATKCFSLCWAPVLTSYLTDWSFMRWSVGCPVILLIIAAIRTRISDVKRAGLNLPSAYEVVCLWEQNARNVEEICASNTEPFKDWIYAESCRMARKAKIRMPIMYWVEDDQVNAYTFRMCDGRNIIVLYSGLLRSHCYKVFLCLEDIASVIAHEMGHIISEDQLYGVYIDSCIGGLRWFWKTGLKTVEKGNECLNPPNGNDANPIEYLGGVACVIVGHVLMIVGGFAHLSSKGIAWLRDRIAEYIADSRGASLIGNERAFAEMIILLHCTSLSQAYQAYMQQIRAHVNAINCPGDEFGKGRLDVHPDPIYRIRKLCPEFDGDFVGMSRRIYENRKKGEKND